MFKQKKFLQPVVVHETASRLRLRWKKLADPRLDPELLEAWFETHSGIHKARVNPGAFSLILVHDGKNTRKQEVFDVLGHIPEIVFSRLTPAEPRRRLIDLVFSLGLAGIMPFLPLVLQRPLAWAMGLPAVFDGAKVLFEKGLKVRVLDMTTIGISLLRDNLTTASSISAMIVVGEYLRQSTEDRAGQMLRSLLTDPVRSVWVLKDGVEIEVPYADVRPDDLILVGTGELVPVDGIIHEGEALLDQSSITGESEPVHIKRGENILSGSIVIEGRLVILAVQTGDQTNIARISSFISTMLREKSPKEKQSERLADLLTPLTLGLGTGVYAFTRDFQRALAVLTIDYACAVKLPTPVVIKGSMSAASRSGVLVKSGSSLELFAQADAFVFDKTGTLTEGRMEVTDIVCCADLKSDELLALCASVEDRYGHPVGRAVVAQAQAKGLSLQTVQNADFSVAHGVSATVGGQLIRVGSEHFLAEDCGIDCSAVAAQVKKLRGQGKNILFAAADTQLLGILALRDKVRLEAAWGLRQLRAQGVKKIIVLSGDYKQSVLALHDALPEVDAIKSRLLPEEKAQAVAELRAQGYTVAVVGDGINDAPAFAAADVAVSMSASTGLARETARIVLLQDSLNGLVSLRAVSERAGSLLRSSFRLGVAVNTGLMLGATMGLLSPVTAVLVHNATTFAILTRAALCSTGNIPEK